jgi:hypothetical protein
MTIYNDYRLANNILTGSGIARPAAGTVGRIYMPTDGYYTSRDNGVGWDTYVNGFKCTNPPAVNTFTAVNVGAETTLVADGDGLLFTQSGTGSSSSMQAAYVVATPTPPYSLIVGLEVMNIQPVDMSCIGLCLTNGTSNPATITYRCWEIHGSNHCYFEVVKYSSINVGVAAYSGFPAPLFPPLNKLVAFFKLEDDSTNRKISVSPNCRNWMLVHSVGRTDYLTPTHIGLIAGQDVTSVATTTVRSQMKIFHWSLG